MMEPIGGHDRGDTTPAGAPAQAGAGDGKPTTGRRAAPLAMMATGGLEFAAAILVCLFAGQWLDARLGTAPWLLILGVAIGAAAGFYNLVRTVTTAGRRDSSHGPPRR